MKNSENNTGKNFLTKNTGLRNAIIVFAVIEMIAFLIFFYFKFRN